MTIVLDTQKAAWRDHGHELKPGTSVEKAVSQAGLDWEVQTRQLSYRTDRGTRKKASASALIRADTGDLLSVVGPRYKPFQNQDVFNFFSEYVDRGDMALEVIGDINNGRQLWAMAKLAQSFKFGKDLTEGYVLLIQPHEYGKGVIIKMCSRRVICENMLTALVQGEGDGVRLWHHREWDDELLKEAQSRLLVARERFDAHAENAKQLTGIHLTEPQVLGVTAKHFGGTPTEGGDDLKPSGKRIVELYHGEGAGAELKASQGTAWGYFNAATQYFDWEYGKSSNARLYHGFLGRTQVRKTRLMNDLLALAAG